MKDLGDFSRQGHPPGGGDKSHVLQKCGSVSSVELQWFVFVTRIMWQTGFWSAGVCTVQEDFQIFNHSLQIARIQTQNRIILHVHPASQQTEMHVDVLPNIIWSWDWNRTYDDGAHIAMDFIQESEVRVPRKNLLNEVRTMIWRLLHL